MIAAQMSFPGTLLPSGEAASCPQLAEEPYGRWPERSGFGPNCDIGWIEMLQRGSLLPYRGVLSFLSKAREASGSEAPRFHHVLGGAAAAWPHQLGAQQPSNSRRIAFVHSGIPAAKLSESGGVFWIKTFYEELRKLGYAEGINLVVERFSAEGNTSRYESLAAEVVARAPELIVANQNVLVKALTTATATIPIVGITTDPVAVGLVSNIARPGGNLTGVSVDGGAGLNAKRLQILKEIVPAATRIAFVTSRRQEVEALGVPIIERLLAEVTETELGRVLDEMAREKIDAVLVSQGGDFLAHRTLIVGLAAKHRLPAMYPYRDYVDLGGLVA